MWEKILLAVAVTFSLHIFAGIDLSDIKPPLASSSPVTTEDSKISGVLSFQKTVHFSNSANINSFFKK
ncbi:MAG: hypothetical protein WBA93_10510 [Microcoleaceae cyanobacterium]